jgi:hypothetical protein
MTTIKLLSTELIALAMFTTSAVARENFAAGRRIILRGVTSYMGNSAPAEVARPVSATWSALARELGVLPA